MTTNLHQISTEIVSALGDDWRFDPGYHELLCHLVRSDGLALYVLVDPNKPRRIAIHCDSPRAQDIYGHPISYETGPSITVAASRTPTSIVGDIRQRLLPDANAWYTKAHAWRLKTDAQFAEAEAFRGQLLSLPGAQYFASSHKVYGPHWECEPYTDTATLIFRSLPSDQALVFLHAFVSLQEKKALSLSSPVQSSMFPDGDDLPMFTLAEARS